MYIVIHCGGMPFDGNTIHERSLGGSETAAHYLALELTKKGHNVSVFTNLQEDNTRRIEGVRYSWSGPITKEAPLGSHFMYYAENTPHDVMIIQRHPQAFARRYASTINLLWMHDLALYRYAPMMQSQMWNVDGVLTVSEFHRQQTAKVYGLNIDNVFAIQNGVDLKLFRGLAHSDTVKPIIDKYYEKNLLVYSSRPERGLVNLVKPEGIMERLGEDYHLLVCGYENTTTQMEGLYKYLYSRIDELPNTTNVGALTKSDLAYLMRKADVLAYPTSFEEVSCITAMEAAAAGLPFVSSKHAALPETCEGGGVFLLDLNEKGEVNTQEFVDQIKLIFEKKHSDKFRKHLMTEQRKVARNRYQWADAGQKLLKVINECYSRITEDTRLLNAMRTSDIVRYNTLPHEKDGAVYWNNHWQYTEFYNFFRTESELSDHYNYKKEEFKRHVPRGSPRYEVLLDRLVEYGERYFFDDNNRVMQIADVGGNIGHYAIGIVQDLPKRIFETTGRKVSVVVAIDEVSDAAREFGKKWIEAEELNEYIHYIQDGNLKFEADVIFVGELLEHLPRPTEFFNRVFQDYGTRNSFVCINVPYGPWEAQEYRKTDPHREHLWHFSRGDLEKMFGRFHDYRLSCLPYGKSVSGEPMGNYLVTFQSKGKKKADYPLTDSTLYMPRESVSLCMIVKDGEASLKRCLDSVIGLVDEVIVGIDETTTDRTLDILQQYKKAHEKYISFTEFDIRGCIFSGFDVARNRVIDKATCDWILWLDADEVLYGLNNLPKYLKSNQFAGYLIKQQHFSVEPAGILRTDFPAKIFRRSSDVRFWGVVHEHPGKSPNEGVGNTAILPDVIVKHDGYETENIRRTRFQRNVQLMIRDREKYPERTLGVFLWLRDISHMIKFELEKTGNQITDDMIIKAKRGIELWEELQEKADVRMLADALEYYTNFVNVLGGGFEMSVGVSASKTNSTSSSLREKTKTARFLNKDHAVKYINKLFKHEVKHYESRYY